MPSEEIGMIRRRRKQPRAWLLMCWPCYRSHRIASVLVQIQIRQADQSRTYGSASVVSSSRPITEPILTAGRTSGPPLCAGEHALADGVQQNDPGGLGFAVELHIKRTAERPKECVAQRAVMLGPHVVCHVAGSEFGQLRSHLVEVIQ